MKSISLTSGMVAVLDDKDYERLSGFTWHATRSYAGSTWYARRNVRRDDGVWTTVYMHREVSSYPSRTRVDHKDGDGLNNQRDNLRAATQVQNLRNARRRCDNTSGFKGVSYDTRKKRWRANIRYDHRQIHLGRFKTPEEAYAAYCAAAAKYFGEFARTP